MSRSGLHIAACPAVQCRALLAPDKAVSALLASVLQGLRPRRAIAACLTARPAMNGRAHCSTYCLSAHTCDLRQGAILTRDIRADRFLTVITQKPLAHMHACLPALTSSVSVRSHLLITASPLPCNHLHTWCSGGVLHSAAANAASCSRGLKARYS